MEECIILHSSMLSSGVSAVSIIRKFGLYGSLFQHKLLSLWQISFAIVRRAVSDGLFNGDRADGCAGIYGKIAQ